MNQSEIKKKVPKYETVKRYLLSMIESEELKPGDKIPTEDELADHFSVSLTTIRKALSDLAREGVIRRIKKKGTFVSEEKPQPPVSEDALRIISFILPLSARTDNNLMQHVRGAQEYLAAHGYSMMIQATNDKIESEKHFIKQAIKEPPSGLIIFPSNPEKNLDSYFRLRQHNIPYVLIDRYPDGFPVNSVVCDNFGGAFQATEHLISLGHRKILFVTYVGSNQAEIVRCNGYRMAMKAHGMDDSFPSISHLQKEDILQAVLIEGFTAFVCANDYCALEMLQLLSGEGISVPENVSIIGFDGQQATEYVTPPLTTVLQPCFEIGYTAAELLVDLIENPQQDLKQSMIPVHLAVRKSTTAPKTEAEPSANTETHENAIEEEEE